jgi:hypothetical protein
MEKFYPDTKYFIVPELHKSRVVHYHVVCTLPVKLNDKERAKIWPYGFSTMKRIANVDGLLYLTKYLSKSFRTPDWFGRRRFYVSNGLARSSRLNDVYSYLCSEFIKDWKVKPAVKIFYTSPYHGDIEYRAYLIGNNWLPHALGKPFST